MLQRAETTGTRPVVYVEAPTPIAASTDARQEAFKRLTQAALGQQFQAKVLSQLDDGTFMVRISDTAARMSLPAGTKIGDSLPMTLVANSPRPTFLLGTESDAEAPTLSSAARLIDNLLKNAQQSGTSNVVASKIPLLPSPAAANATSQVATALQGRLEFSGLFYESHVGEWADGKRSLQDLMREPQARLGAGNALRTDGPNAKFAPLLDLAKAWESGGRSLPDLVRQLQTQAATQAATSPASGLDKAHSEFSQLLALVREWTGSGRSLPDLMRELQTKADANTMSRPSGMPNEPARLLNLVREWTDNGGTLQDLARQAQAQPAADTESGKLLNLLKEWTDSGRALQDLTRETQNNLPQASLKTDVVNNTAAQLINQQLSVLEQQRIVWQGELWPGQKMEWEVSRDAPESHAGDDEDNQPWQSVVRFELPTLGTIAATIHLIGDRVHVQVRTTDEATATSLRAYGNVLADALAAAGSPLESLTVKQDGHV